MRKALASILLVLLLAVPLLAGGYRFDAGEERHIRAFAPKKKSNIAPSIRKCLDVKCSEGLYCFHGRCTKLDGSCLTLKCQKGFRCVNGSCVQRRTKAKKLICSPLGFKLKKQQCDKDLRKACRKNRNQVKQDVCGFNPKDKEYFDYPSPCAACEDRNSRIRFFYSVPCPDAPRICSKEEECMNGICSSMFEDPIFQNNESCNKNGDCEILEYCAGHKCIDKRDLFNYLDSKQEEETILIKVA